MAELPTRAHDGLRSTSSPERDTVGDYFAPFAAEQWAGWCLRAEGIDIAEGSDSLRAMQQQPRKTVFELLAMGSPVIGPGVYDGISARLAEEAGFGLAFLSGYCLSASLLGEPDFGLLSGTQTVEAATRICPAVGIPIIVDIDTGYGNAFNVERVVEALVRAGAAGCFLEDQVWPKRCGHMDRKRVVPLEEYLPKLRAALAARGNAAFHVTARTDARGALGLDEAVTRAKAFRDAGADAVFVEAPESVSELEDVAREVTGITLVANMVEQGKTPVLPAAELHAMGFSLIAAPLAGLLAAARAIRETFATLAQAGTTSPCADRLLTFDAMNDLLGLKERYARERGWLSEPPGMVAERRRQ